MKRNSFFILAVIGIIYFQAGTALALTISASASGSATPPLVYNPNQLLSVTSGSFTYTGWSSVADGNDEDVDWIMDFTTDPNYGAFISTGSLGSARLIMSLIPQNYLVNEDIVGFPDAPADWIKTPIQILPVGVTSTINVDLLKFYTASIILDLLESGKIRMHYADDSIISYVQIDLNTGPVSPVPAPATLVLLASGLLGLESLRRCQIVLRK